MMGFKALKQNGDTIVEVLLAIVVVSATLGAAFTTIDRGTDGARASQERAEALKYVESQIELFKAGASSGTAGLFGRGNAFCLTSSGGVLEVKEAFTTPATVETLDGQSLGDYTTECKNGSIPDGYNVSISEAADHVFTFRARWENVSGNNRDQIEIKYKLQP